MKESEKKTLPDSVHNTEGRIVARRIVSAELGELWIATNRPEAEAAGLVGAQKKTTAPVYYLDKGEADFVKTLTPKARTLYHEFKKEFDSPAGADKEKADTPVKSPCETESQETRKDKT